MKKTILTLLSAISILTVSAQEADTTIVLKCGYEVLDSITISKSSPTFLQTQEAEAVIEGIKEAPVKYRTIVDYVLSHPDNDGSVFLMRQLNGAINNKKCLSALTERAKTGLMKPLYDYYAAGIEEVDSFMTKMGKSIVIGEEAKDFTLEDINGQQITLSSLRGKHVLLDFWASWCGPCIKSFPHLKTIYEQHCDKLEILGIACHDKQDKWRTTVDKYELPWLHVFDADDKNGVGASYGVLGVPTYILINPEGKIVQWMMDDPDTFDLYFTPDMFEK